MGRIGRGVVAGAAGTVALQAATYGDMLARGRPASSLPGKAAAKLAERVGVDLTADDDETTNRREALGSLSGYATGVGVGVVLSVLVPRLGRRRLLLPATVAGALAMAGANGPMVLEGLTDPKEWGATAWASDIVPHVAYGLGVVASLRLLRHEPWRPTGRVLGRADGHRPLVVE